MPPLAAAEAGAPEGASPVTLALAAIGAVIFVGVAVIGGLATFGGNDGAAPAADAAVTTSLALREPIAEPTTVVTATTLAVQATPPEPVTTRAPATTVARATTVAPTTAPSTTAPATSTTALPVETTPPTTIAPVAAVPASTPTDPNLAESKAVVRGGQIYLTGAVPTAEAGAAIESLAAEILGPQNVFNEYVVAPGAGDPNLGNITVEDTITFASNSAFIQESSEGLLNQGLALMNIRPSMTITIVGHTDSLGTAEGNLELSQARADAVKQWFVDRGIDPARLAAVGRGETEPIADNATQDGRRVNRRIQFFLENILGA